MYTYYRIEERFGHGWFLWDDLYATAEDARREMNRVDNSSGRAFLLRVVRYEQIGTGPPQRTKV